VKQKQVPSGSPACRFHPWSYFLTAAVTGRAIMSSRSWGRKCSPPISALAFRLDSPNRVTLLALAPGYFLWRLAGGPVLRPPGLCCIGLAAAYLGFHRGDCQSVSYGFLQMNLGGRIHPPRLVLFFIPLTLLATTGPFLARLLTQSVEASAAQVDG